MYWFRSKLPEGAGSGRHRQFAFVTRRHLTRLVIRRRRRRLRFINQIFASPGGVFDAAFYLNCRKRNVL